MQTHFAGAAAVFIGQLVETGADIHEDWSVSAAGRLKVERWFKGTQVPEVRVLLPSGFPRGARLLLFARTNSPADRLRQTQSRRAWQPDGKRADAAPKVPDADIPDLTAAGACSAAAFALNAASVAPLPGYSDDKARAWAVALSNDLLKALEAMPAAGDGGRLELALRAFDMSDFMQRTELRVELKEAKDAAPGGLKLSGPSTVQHLSVYWNAPRNGWGGWGRDRLPAGEYRLEGLEVPGYDLYCGGGSGPDCARVTVEDRGRVRHELFYIPEARLQVKLVDQQGVPVEGQGLLKVRRLSADPAGIPFRPSREATFVAHPPADQSAHHLGLSAGRYAIEWLLPRVAPGQPDDWPWARKVLASTALPLHEGSNVAVTRGDNLVTLTLPEEARPAELRARAPGCKPGGVFQVSLLTEWRPGRSAGMQNVAMEVSDRCEIRYQGFAGQHLHLHYARSPSETWVAWVELQPGQNQVDLMPQKAQPH